MNDLKLNFLDDPYSKGKITYVDLLEKYGKKITDYSNGYFSHAVATTMVDDNLKDISLYILAPEIPYEYRIINIEIINIQTVKLSMFLIGNNSPQSLSINISKGLESLDNSINDLLSSVMANESLRLLVYQIELKRRVKVKEKEEEEEEEKE